jgi:hypothetical protein
MTGTANPRDYGIVTACYWAFTLTDGALRMLVLLHLHDLGYAPLQLALFFVGYEVFGAATNLVGGWLGSRIGLKPLLISGLALQVVALSVLTGPDTWITVPVVIGAQALSGIAKDLVKTCSKSWIKLVVDASDDSHLMHWIALLTGSKNALKGVGYFLGGSLLAYLGFRGALLSLVGLCAAALILSLLPRAVGKSDRRVPFRGMLSSDPRINWLSAARLFLFGSRDVWFVIALPVYLATELAWHHAWVGTFLAVWVIGYGFIQASSPGWVGGGSTAPPNATRCLRWTALCIAPLVGLAIALVLNAPPGTTLIMGLAAFAVVFATTSAVHSFLIVSYAEGDQVSLRVGFYYMSNALGRLAGTVISGAMYQWAGGGRNGLVACLGTASVLMAISTLACVPIVRAERAAQV